MKTKRLFACFLCIMMLFSLLPAGARAEFFDPIDGLASLGEFTPPEMILPDDVGTVVADVIEAADTPEEGTAPQEEETAEEPEEQEREDDGKLRIYPADGSFHLTIEGVTETESPVPPELRKLVNGQAKPVRTEDGQLAGQKLYLKTPDAEELYLDRLEVEKTLGYYTADWTVVNLTDAGGERKALTAAGASYNVIFSGPATEKFAGYEPVFALLTLHWDEKGAIVGRDVEFLETTHTESYSSWSFITDCLSTLVIAVPTGQPYMEGIHPKTDADGYPIWSLSIPSSQPIAYKAERTEIGTISVKEASNFTDGQAISVTLDYSSFQSDTYSIPIEITVIQNGLESAWRAGTTISLSPDGSDPITLFVNISAEAWTAAPHGAYAISLIFNSALSGR